MKKGFMDFVAISLIPDCPGHTSEWYAREYLNLFPDSSDAKDPVQSLANTLDKQVREGREKRIKRKRIGGIYLYFPASASDEGHLEDIVVQISLSTQELKDIDNLVAVEKFNNRNDAIKWLVVEGIKANRGFLDKVADIRKQIEELKRDI